MLVRRCCASRAPYQQAVVEVRHLRSLGTPLQLRKGGGGG